MNGKTSRNFVDKLAAVLFLISLLLVALFYGMAAQELKIFPHQIVAEGITEMLPLLPEKWANKFKKKKKGINWNLSEDKPAHLFPIRHEKHGVNAFAQDKVSPGVTLLTGYWPESDWGAGIRVIDFTGKVLHHWDTNPRALFPFKKIPRNTYVHGSYLFPNGDVLFNIEYGGLIRMNSCGEVMWTLDYATHHSVTPDEQGNFWVSGYKSVKKGDKRVEEFPELVVPFGEETMLQVSPEGEILNEISVLDALYNSEYKHLLWHYKRLKFNFGDILHMNDVEALSTSMADGYELFEAGDLVVSLKYISAVAVISPQGEIKWLSAGDFTDQHDPDFEGDGWISVFDNRLDGSREGTSLGGSSIRAVNPATGEIRPLYPTDTKQKFYTPAGGKHQLLENGNRLITEAQAGRVFEVAPGGEIVWEWISMPYDTKLVAEMLEGTRYSYSPEEVAAWECGN